jgi:hypothetical protein
MAVMMGILFCRSSGYCMLMPKATIANDDSR